MAIEELNRTNIQALWRYMPHQPFNWSSKVSVLGQTPRQVSTLDVPESWVAPQLRRLVRPFAESASGIPGVGPELEAIDRHQFTLVKAEDLRASRYPNTFLCTTCKQFRTIRAGERVPSCPNNHGTMEQFPWVEVHECGHLKELAPPRCANNCRAPMGLFNTSSFQTGRWYWRCTRCNTRSDQQIVRWCSSCRTGRPQVIRIPQTMAYYPQQITVINPPTRGAYAALAHEHVHAAAVAQSLGILPPGIEGLRLAGAGSTGGAVEKFQEMAALLGWQPGNEMYDKGLGDARARQGNAPAWATEVDALGLDPETIDALGEECRQLSLARSALALTVEDLLATSASGPLEPTYRTYPGLFTHYGLADVTLLRQLPIAYVVAGYTRVLAKATGASRRGDLKAKFRFFPAGRDSKFPMYGVRTETEGLLFRLDQLEIVRWLVDSRLVEDPGVSTADEAQRWLFAVTDPVTDIFRAPENRMTRAVLGLTHSFAHRAMKALAARCGLNVDSLAEYLFPSNGAFLIYANTRSEFTLGGLEHVYRYDLGDALRELDAESRCVFDPPCRHSFGGACAACLYVSEVACNRFNTVLDRNLLFGSVPAVQAPIGQADGMEASEEVTWRAYWSR